MPIRITDSKLERELFLNGIQMSINEKLPDDVIMMLGDHSAVIIISGKIRSFQWDKARMYPHGAIVFDNLREVKKP